MTTFPADLLPDTARAGQLGLEIGGCDVAELAEQHGTPLYVYDERHLRERCRQARAAFPDGASYASKAFLCRSIARLMRDEGLGLDVCSGGELAIALAAGVTGQAITFHGNNKSTAELDAALRAGVGRIVVDGHDEVDRLDALASAVGTTPRVLVRINPGVAVATHPSIRTGHADSKFGTRLADGAADALVSRVRTSRRLRFAGVHVHVGSQLIDLAPLDHAIGACAAFADAVGAEELIVGGGLGVPYVVGDSAPTISTWADVAIQRTKGAGFKGHVMAEPGRVLTATAGVTVYTIGAIKRAASTTFLATDGGISDNPRPALYAAKYQPLLVRHPLVDRRGGRFTVVGKSCESSDVFASDVAVTGDPRVGDLLCIPVTGAYSYAMSSRYNGLPRPAVVITSDSKARVMIRRETVDDLLSTDEVAEPQPA